MLITCVFCLDRIYAAWRGIPLATRGYRLRIPTSSNGYLIELPEKILGWNQIKDMWKKLKNEDIDWKLCLENKHEKLHKTY